MKTLMIDYDLMRPGQKYEAISEYLTSYNSWAKVLQSTWMIRTVKSATQVRDDLLRIIDSNDKVLVTEVTGAIMAWHGLDEKVAEWIKNQYRAPSYFR